ncbi:ribonuclease H-like domain-containing protein [Tanacetum coccineum]
MSQINSECLFFDDTDDETEGGMFTHRFLIVAALVIQGHSKLQSKHTNEAICRTPVDTESKLRDDCDPVFDPTLYQSLAGSLQYLTFTRLNIAYVVQQVCLYMHEPREPPFSALKRILRYVRGTLDHGLQLFSSSTTSLVAYSDADWAGCPTTRRSLQGYCSFDRRHFGLQKVHQPNVG